MAERNVAEVETIAEVELGTLGVTVNRRAVDLPSYRLTSLEIKRTSIAGDVELERHFQLAEDPHDDGEVIDRLEDHGRVLRCAAHLLAYIGEDFEVLRSLVVNLMEDAQVVEWQERIRGEVRQVVAVADDMDAFRNYIRAGGRAAASP
jgi:hypothetical protein